MTPTEIHEAIKAKRTEIERIEAEIIRPLERDIFNLKAQYPVQWKKGDRYRTPTGVFEVVSVLPPEDDGQFYTFGMQVSKIRKDGTRSSKYQYHYGIDTAERIEKEQL